MVSYSWKNQKVSLVKMNLVCWMKAAGANAKNQDRPEKLVLHGDLKNLW
jgi:hypothetical protein